MPELFCRSLLALSGTETNPWSVLDDDHRPEDEPCRFADWVPDVSSSLVTSTIEQRIDWSYDYNRGRRTDPVLTGAR